MNYPIVVSGALVFLAFLAHVFVGTGEALSTRPRRVLLASTEARTVDRHWAQSMCAFQMLSVDLLAVALGLLVLGTAESIPARRELSLGVALLLALWGVVWLVQLLLLGRRSKDYLWLCQWVLWFVCSALVFWGAA